MIQRPLEQCGSEQGRYRKSGSWSLWSVGSSSAPCVRGTMQHGQCLGGRAVGPHASPSLLLGSLARGRYLPDRVFKVKSSLLHLWLTVSAVSVSLMCPIKCQVLSLTQKAMLSDTVALSILVSSWWVSLFWGNVPHSSLGWPRIGQIILPAELVSDAQ